MKVQPSHDGKGNPVSFATLMALEKINGSTYRSLTAAFEPGGGTHRPWNSGGPAPRAFGGHVYAQAVYAAAQTVAQGFVVHSATGYFVQLGRCDLPFVYEIQTVRDGKGFCVRIVNVTQEEGKGICFSCNCSFKVPDQSPIEWQQKVDLKEKYKDVLGHVKTPAELPDCPTLDMPWARDDEEYNRGASPWPGLRCKKVDMTAYNKHRPALARRSLIYYSAIGTMPPIHDQPNLHACAHLYASDVNSLFMVAAHTGLERNYNQMASLSQTVVFHSQALGFAVGNGNGKKEWYAQEVSTDRMGDGRAVHRSRIWSEEGVHVASTLQDGLVRLSFENDEEIERAKDGLKGVPVWHSKL